MTAFSLGHLAEGEVMEGGGFKEHYFGAIGVRKRKTVTLLLGEVLQNWTYPMGFNSHKLQGKMKENVTEYTILLMDYSHLLFQLIAILAER